MKYSAILFIFYFLFPVLIIYATHKSSFLKRIGAVVLSYILGLFVGNIGWLPKPSDTFRNFLAEKTFLPDDQVQQMVDSGQLIADDILYNKLAFVQDTIISVVILLAIPLLLFSLDVRKWFGFAKDALKSLILALVSLLIVIFLGYFMFKNDIPEAWKIGGLLVGVYTGGTPNLAAIATALEVNPNLFVLTHTYDLVLGAFLLLFLLTIAQKTFNWFLPTFKEKYQNKEVISDEYNEDIDDFSGILNKKTIWGLVKVFLIDILVVAISVGVGFIVPEAARMVTIILLVTTLALALSYFTNISKIDKTFQFGMYLIIVFSLVVSSMGDLRNMFSIDFLHLFLFVFVAVVGSVIIHVFLSKIFKVDSDTTIITITALTYSPPFVPVVAGALKNKNIIISGLTVGIIGYAFGNYIGVLVAYILKVL